MITDACSWDHPGTDRYTGNIPAAIAAYGFAPTTRDALIAAFETRRFTDRVVITRDEIRGDHGWEPDIRAMHFGSRGVICGTVTRGKWAADRVERALVFCAEGECVAWPSVCGNLFRITPRGGAGTLAVGRLPPYISAGGTPLPPGAGAVPDPAGYALPALGPGLAVLLSAPAALSLAAPGSFGEAAAVVPVASVAMPLAWAAPTTLNPLAVGPQVITTPTPTPLPEPGTWAMWLGGLAGLSAWLRRRATSRC